jgi:C1A family cysteine protease
MLKLSVLVSLFGYVMGSAEVQQKFTEFMKMYKKEYLGNEVFTRFNVFKNNLAMIESHNAQNLGWTMGINQFADLTSQEFEQMYLRYTPEEHNSSFVPTNAPEAEVDWSAQRGIVTPIKDQGQCGSCWAFSTTGSVESALAVAGKELVSVSEQQLVDCSASTGNQGCNGGLMDNAFKWIIKNNGIAAEADYKYTAKDGSCQSVRSVSQITGYKDIKAKDENALKAAVTVQPVSIAVDARKWQLYKSGVFDGCSTLIQLDHGVLAVGYSDSGSYWKVKNSWGRSWGEEGFIRLALNKNECGLTNAASFPTA